MNNTLKAESPTKTNFYVVDYRKDTGWKQKYLQCTNSQLKKYLNRLKPDKVYIKNLDEQEVEFCKKCGAKFYVLAI